VSSRGAGNSSQVKKRKVSRSNAASKAEHRHNGSKLSKLSKMDGSKDVDYMAVTS